MRTVAENLKSKIQGSTRSFGQYLRNQWISRKRSEPNQTDLQAYGSEELHRGAFAFVRDVVGRLSPDDEWLIIDGVRHIEVQDIIEYMFDEVVLIGVDAAEEQIQQRLLGRSDSADVERIRSHETEQDVPLLLEKAKLTLRADSKLEVSREFLSQLIGG